MNMDILSRRDIRLLTRAVLCCSFILDITA